MPKRECVDRMVSSGITTRRYKYVRVVRVNCEDTVGRVLIGDIL